MYCTVCDDSCSTIYVYTTINYDWYCISVSKLNFNYMSIPALCTVVHFSIQEVIMYNDEFPSMTSSVSDVFLHLPPSQLQYRQHILWHNLIFTVHSAKPDRCVSGGKKEGGPQFGYDRSLFHTTLVNGRRSLRR